MILRAEPLLRVDLTPNSLVIFIVPPPDNLGINWVEKSSAQTTARDPESVPDAPYRAA